MQFREALIILMQAATNDVVGSGMGYRKTTDKWRENVREAWEIVFKYVYKRKPEKNDYFNAGM